MIAYAMDHLQKNNVVTNQIQVLMVQAGDESTLSIDDSFAIYTSKYRDVCGRQFILMGKTFNTDMTKTLWYLHTKRMIQMLSSFENLIRVFGTTTFFLQEIYSIFE